MMMTGAPQRILGLDIGRVQTRASLLGISEGAFRLLGHGLSNSSWGDGRGLTAGVSEALQNLEQQSGGAFLYPGSSDSFVVSEITDQTDLAMMTLSGGPRLRAALMGLTAAGSMRAVRALAGSMPLEAAGVFGLGDSPIEQEIITWFAQTRPDLVLITGGGNDGAAVPVRLLVETTRLACLLLPNVAKPQVIYAGNSELVDWVRRRLDPLVTLKIASNLQPAVNCFDLEPVQNLLNDLMIRSWLRQVPGLKDLGLLTGRHQGTKAFLLSRMVRFLNRAYGEQRQSGEGVTPDAQRGVLTVDLGGGSTVLAAVQKDRAGLVELPAWEIPEDAIHEIAAWCPVPVGARTVRMYLNNHAIHPAIVPGDVMELALSQSLARYRLRQAVSALGDRFPQFSFDGDRGLISRFEPIIASGSVLTQAPTAGQSMLILLDALQPRGVTTMVLDRYHLLPILGLAAESLPILPVQMMDSNAFLNLGTVIAPVSSAPEGKTIMVVRVMTDAGESYSAEITQGLLRRLPLPSGTPARLTLKPTAETDIGFGGPGVGGRLAVTGGVLGLVVDARRRPLNLPEGEEARLEQLRKWLWALGG